MDLRWLILLTATLSLAAGRGEERGAGAAGAIRKTAALDSYSFRIEERPGPGTGTGVEGKYQKGQPVFFRADGIEFYRQGPVLVYLQGERWQQSKTGIESDPLRILGAAAQVRGARLPHEELAALDGRLRDVHRTETKDGGAIWSGTLDDEGVKELVGSEYRSVAQGGKAGLWVNRGGLVTRYEITIRVQGRLGDADIDGSTSRSVSLSDAGSIRVEAPEGAKQALK